MGLNLKLSTRSMFDLRPVQFVDNLTAIEQAAGDFEGKSFDEDSSPPGVRVVGPLISCLRATWQSPRRRTSSTPRSWQQARCSSLPRLHVPLPQITIPTRQVRRDQDPQADGGHSGGRQSTPERRRHLRDPRRVARGTRWLIPGWDRNGNARSRGTPARCGWPRSGIMGLVQMLITRKANLNLESARCSDMNGGVTRRARAPIAMHTALGKASRDPHPRLLDPTIPCVDGLRTVWIAAHDDALVASARSAVQPVDAATSSRPAGQAIACAPDSVGRDVYICCAWVDRRPLTWRTYVLTVEPRRRAAACGGPPACSIDPITRCCSRLPRRSKAGRLLGASEARPRRTLPKGVGSTAPRPCSPDGRQGQVSGSEETTCRSADLRSRRDTHLVSATIDPVTGLFNYAFLGYKVDEFKRARRFHAPLAAMLGVGQSR